MIPPKHISPIKLPLELLQPRQPPRLVPVKRLQRLRVRVVLVHVQLVVAAGALHLGAEAGRPAVDRGREGGVRVPGCEDAGGGGGGLVDGYGFDFGGWRKGGGMAQGE